MLGKFSLEFDFNSSLLLENGCEFNVTNLILKDFHTEFKTKLPLTCQAYTKKRNREQWIHYCSHNSSILFPCELVLN